MTWRQHLTFVAKLAAAHVLYYLGLLQLWQRVALRRRAIVLMYHRVLSVEERHRSGSHPALITDRDLFAKQMRALKRRFCVVTADEFVNRLQTKTPFRNSSCLITFDDGWRDNFANALPVLREQGLPAVTFLPVNYIGDRRVFWQEALTQLLTRAIERAREDAGLRARVRATLEPYGLAHLLEISAEPSRGAILEAIGLQKRVTRPAIEALQARLSAELGLTDCFAADDGFIDWNQAREMSEAGIACGGHGADHLLLTQVSSEDARREIRASREVIHQKLGRPPAIFSYPNGYWNPELASEVKSGGYSAAVTTRRGFVSCVDDPFSVPRVNIHDGVTSTIPMFLARVVGLL